MTRYREAYRLDVVVWHTLMAVWMTVMLTSSLAGRHHASGFGWYDAAALVTFAAGTAWAAIRLTSPRSRPAYLRLAVCCGAMVAMLAVGSTAGPVTVPAAAMPAMGPANTGQAMGAMSAMSHPAVAGTSRAVVAAALAALLIVLVCHLVGMVRRPFREDVPSRRRRPAAGALLELGTATAMAVMLGIAL